MHTPKIGVFISHIFGNYQTHLCQGIIDKAAEYGLFIDIFATTDGENLGDYGLGEKSILRIPYLSEYDGIIFAPNTYLLPGLCDDIRSALSKDCHCPIIEITQDSSTFTSVKLDNLSPVADLVEHLVTVHNYKRIAYLGNALEANFSDARLDYYKQTLSGHGIPIPNEYIQSADYSEASILTALNKMLEAPKKPQAIVCYNDRMALTAMMLLQGMEYHIPTDIAITGCDCIEMGQKNTPSLTSVTFPIYEAGMQAVDEILARLDNKDTSSSPIVRSSIVYGASCGCNAAYIPHLRFEHRLVDRIDNTELALLNNIDMAACLHDVTDIDEGADMLEKYVKAIPDCKEFYLCLYGDWNHISDKIQTLTLAENDTFDADTVLLKFAMKDKKRLPECTFSKSSNLPDYIYRNSSRVYIYSPLYFGEKAYGYIALSYENNRLSYPFTFFSWIMNINTMLKGIEDKRNMGLLITRLEDIYTRDDLTGLYNRQGFKLVCDSFLMDAAKNRKSLFVAIFDLDNLKMINDTYGHLEGDFAIRVLGHALESAINDGDICARLGGDEFYILGTNYTERSAGQLISRVQKYLDNYNRLHTKEYTISASGGYHITTEFVLSDLQELFDKADRQMYITKNNKKKGACEA